MALVDGYQPPKGLGSWCTAQCWKFRWLADELAQYLLCVKGPKQGSVCLCTCTFGRRHCPDLQCRALSLFHCVQGDIAHSILQDCRGMVYFHMPVLPLALCVHTCTWCRSGCLENQCGHPLLCGKECLLIAH